jgi:hypothetical protein
MADSFADRVRQVFRDFETDGVPSSGAHQVLKSEVRDLLASLVSDPSQDAWATLTRYRSTFTTAI